MGERQVVPSCINFDRLDRFIIMQDDGEYAVVKRGNPAFETMLQGARAAREHYLAEVQEERREERRRQFLKLKQEFEPNG
jgi:hypothetical protein